MTPSGDDKENAMVSRREFMTIAAVGGIAATRPGRAVAQTPKRGGTLTLRTWIGRAH